MGGDEGDELTFIVLALGQLKVRHGSSSPGTPCSPNPVLLSPALGV